MVAPCGCGYSNGQCRTFLSLQRALLDSSELEQQENLGCFVSSMRIFPLVCSFCCYTVAQSCATLCDPRTVACQVPLSMGFPRQEFWSGVSFTSRWCYSAWDATPLSPFLPLLFHLNRERSKRPPARLGFTVTENKPDPGQGTLLVAQSLSL